MTTYEWLSQLNIGDIVVMNHVYLYKVSRITKTQIIIELKTKNGESRIYKFNKNTGYAIGGNVFNTSNIVEPTDELIKKINKYRLQNKIKALQEKLNLENLTIEELQNFFNLLESITKEK
jgi:hypothetical protein